MHSAKVVPVNGHLPFPTASLTLQAFKSGLKCTQMSLGFLCFSLSNHLNALPAQINLLWHYSGFKNLSTSHGFNFARAVEESAGRASWQSRSHCGLSPQPHSHREQLCSCCFSRSSSSPATLRHGVTFCFPLQKGKEQLIGGVQM